MPGFPIREKGGPCWFSHRSVFSSFEIFERPQAQLPCSDARNYLTHVTNALLLVGPDRNSGFNAIGGDIHIPAGTSKPLLIIADAAAREARN